MRDRYTATPTTSDPSSRHEKEAELYADLESAKIEYETASEDYKRALVYWDEIRQVNLPGAQRILPAPEVSVSQAVKFEHDAFEKYRLAVDAFNRFLNGNLSRTAR